MSRHVFLLSPANCSGRRARSLFNPDAEFALAHRLREPEGIPIGEAFSFMSGLYFRGKLAYARAFAAAMPGSGSLVIAPGRGLLDADHRITKSDLESMARVPVDLENDSYRSPLERDARTLARRGGEFDAVVLLGSIATDKYVRVLLDCFGERLVFPADFVGRGDMSRGGLMLRAAASGSELRYVPVQGATRHGARPPRLEPLRRT